MDLFINASVLTSHDARLLGCTISLLDVTGLKHAEEKLRESRAELARELEDTKKLQKISGLLIEGENADGLYAQILDTAMAIMRADFGSIQMLDPERGGLTLFAWRNFHPKAAAFWQKISIEAGTACGSALRHGERVIVPDVRAVDFLRDSESSRYFSLSGIVAVQSTPLTTREGRTIGMISTHWRGVHTPAERELGLLDILARQAADFFERRRTQEALRESEERFRLFVENVQEYALVQTNADGAITSWNPGAERLFGYTTAEVIGKSFSQLMRPDGEKTKALDREIIAVSKGQRVEDAQWLSRKNDGLFWARCVSEPVYDAAGNLRGIAKLMRDETERRKADEAIRSSLAEKE